jgi:hypothetical protein
MKKKVFFLLTESILLLNCYSENIPFSNSIKVSADTNYKEISWTEGMCDYKGIYDSIKYSYEELKNTYNIFLNSEYIPNFLINNLPDINELAELNVESLNDQESQVLSKIASSKIIKSPIWDSLRNQKYNDIKNLYDLQIYWVQGYRNPELLREYKGLMSCEKYINALIEGGDKLLSIWEEVNIKMRERNGDPESVKKTFYERYNSAEKFKYARWEVITFGWYKCENAASHFSYWIELYDIYKTCFISVKEDCEKD